MKFIIILIIIFFVSTFLISTKVYAADPFCPGFSCPTGQQCEKNVDGSYYCVACPVGADGTPLCRTTATTDANPDATIYVGDVTPPAPVDASPNAIRNFVPTAISITYFFALILALIYLLYGGIKWIMSGGDVKALQNARDTIIHAIIGLILLGVSYPVARLMQEFLEPGNNTRIAAPGTTITLYYCGYGGSYITEWQTNCQNPAYSMSAENWNQLDSATRDRLCISPSECDAGCRQNDIDRIRDGSKPGVDYYTRCRPL